MAVLVVSRASVTVIGVARPVVAFWLTSKVAVPSLPVVLSTFAPFAVSTASLFAGINDFTVRSSALELTVAFERSSVVPCVRVKSA